MAPKNAFDMMRAAAAGEKEKKDAAGSSSTSKSTSAPSGSASTAPVPAMFAKSTFKGSGLGAGPKHSVEEKDQPWVEK